MTASQIFQGFVDGVGVRFAREMVSGQTAEILVYRCHRSVHGRFVAFAPHVKPFCDTVRQIHHPDYY
jgi:hypothetical protein